MNWRNFCLTPEDSILTALTVITTNGQRFALTIDDSGKLLGVVTDGNIRRGFLHGLTVHNLVSEIMNPHPIAVRENTSKFAALRLMLDGGYTHLPVVDDGGRVIDLWALEDLQKKQVRNNPVIIMAGGLGSRLGELTRNCPKPMLKVGGKPILEIILSNFIDAGFYNFFLAVNYKAEQIEKYFGDGSDRGANIQYIKETKPLGTAGALSLLPNTLHSPFIVTNADILARLALGELIDFHEQNACAATMVVKRHLVDVPYGVVDFDQSGKIISLREKPSLSFAISAGINILSPEVLHHIPKDTFFDMPDLYNALLKKNVHAQIFEMDDYWLDIGRLSDYEKANNEAGNIFEAPE